MLKTAGRVLTNQRRGRSVLGSDRETGPSFHDLILSLAQAANPKSSHVSYLAQTRKSTPVIIYSAEMAGTQVHHFGRSIRLRQRNSSHASVPGFNIRVARWAQEIVMLWTIFVVLGILWLLAGPKYT